MRGEFNLTSGQELTIVVGQVGADNPNYDGGTGGGGGTFVIADNNNTPLIVAGGGGGQGGDTHGQNALLSSNGGNGHGNEQGGTNGSGGIGNHGGGGGFDGNGSGTFFGTSFSFGLVGGDGNIDGGFGGGGGAPGGGYDQGGGGGGYSGGGGSNSERGGGGGSFNSGKNQYNIEGFGDTNGSVRIFGGQGASLGSPQYQILNQNWVPTENGKQELLRALGSGYRYATTQEVTKAREAATPGSVNNWPATFQIKPRNLPGSVNEYGFDVQTTTGTWIIKE